MSTDNIHLTIGVPLSPYNRTFFGNSVLLHFITVASQNGTKIYTSSTQIPSTVVDLSDEGSTSPCMAKMQISNLHRHSSLWPNCPLQTKSYLFAFHSKLQWFQILVHETCSELQLLLCDSVSSHTQRKLPKLFHDFSTLGILLNTHMGLAESADNVYNAPILLFELVFVHCKKL